MMESVISKRRIQELKEFSMFGALSDEELSLLAGSMTEKTFEPGAEILKEGEPGDGMFLLLGGNVDVLKKTPYGEDFVTASLSGSDHCTLGEMALIDRDVRSATVRAVSECSTLCLSYDRFNSFCSEYPKIGMELMKAVSLTLVRNLRRENENLRMVYQALIDEIENG